MGDFAADLGLKSLEQKRLLQQGAEAAERVENSPPPAPVNVEPAVICAEAACEDIVAQQQHHPEPVGVSEPVEDFPTLGSQTLYGKKGRKKTLKTLVPLE